MLSLAVYTDRKTHNIILLITYLFARFRRFVELEIQIFVSEIVHTVAL